MTKISHEVPLALLEESLKFNDYDYCLPHLLDKEEQYKQFFYKSRDTGRYVMMDNSLHELGVPYSEDRLLYWLEELRPQEFFVPDFWEDKTKSVVSAKKWASIQLSFPEVTFIAVVQASSYYEAVECYQTYKDLGYKKIAFSYGASYYNEVCPHPHPVFGKALGRIQTITKMHNIGIISQSDRVHLLGCAVPQEFNWYFGMHFIETIDTSNPIMSAIDGNHYDKFGLINKPKSKIDDVLDKEYFVEGRLIHNINSFRSINEAFLRKNWLTKLK